MNSLKDKEFQMVGCLGKHASYTFYKSIRIGERTLSLSNFFPVRIWPDSAILSIAEVQLLWKDRNECLCSLRLYFLPENTPFGRFSFHGEDEVIALQDKVIIRASDLMTWIVDEKDWDWGFLTPSCKVDIEDSPLKRAFMNERFGKDEKLPDYTEQRPDSVVVLNYERYVRLRSVLKRLEGSANLVDWLNHPLVMAIGGLAVGPNCRILFARDVFDYPELEDHELLCNHLAPKLKGRPRKKKRARNPSVGSISNESESSSTASGGSTDNKGKSKKPLNGLSAHSGMDRDIRIPSLPLSKAAAARMMEERAAEGSHKEVVFGNNANGLQILKVDSSHQMLRNGQIASHGGGGMGTKRPYNQISSNKRVVDGRTSASSSAMSMLDGKHINADMLGPGLSELAQKLKKSNALQILAIRPPLGGRELDYDLLQLKRMKMDGSAGKFVRFNSDLLIHPLNSGPFTSRKHTIFGAPIIDKVVSKTHDLVKQLVGHTLSQKSSTGMEVTDIQKPQKQPVVTATIDATAKVTVPTPMGVNSPFRTRKQIFASPSVEKLQALESRHAKSSVDVIDFSVRRSRHNVEISRRSMPSSHSNPESALLDLTVKPMRQPAYSRSSQPDHPPQNMAEKLGLQLTSEVTLFPSPSYLTKVKDISHSKSAQSKSIISMSSASSKNQESIPGGSRKPIRSPSTSIVSQGSSGSSAHGTPSPKDVQMRHHSQHHYPNHLNAKSMFGAPERGGPMIPGLSPNQGHSGNAITIKPVSAEEKKAAANIKELEKVYQSMHASQFLQPSPYVPKMDPTYLSLLANPFLMSPQALMSIPGAMEQFQMYKDLFQQSGLPQFPPQWPPQGPGNDRASK